MIQFKDSECLSGLIVNDGDDGCRQEKQSYDDYR